MATERDWLDYLGAAGGVVGAITGIAGCISGAIALRRTSEHKRLDLRLALRTTIEALKLDAAALGGLIEAADRSRQASMAADGLRRSGQAERWRGSVEVDRVTAKQLEDKTLGLPIDLSGMSEATLEELTASVKQIEVQLHEVTTKYQNTLAKDSKDVDRRREEAQARHAGPPR